MELKTGQAPTTKTVNPMPVDPEKTDTLAIEPKTKQLQPTVAEESVGPLGCYYCHSQPNLTVVLNTNERNHSAKFRHGIVVLTDPELYAQMEEKLANNTSLRARVRTVTYDEARIYAEVQQGRLRDQIVDMGSATGLQKLSDLAGK